MWKIIIGLLCFGCAFGQLNWVTLARVPGFSGYMSRVVQEMVYDMEKIEWCTLRINEYSQTLDETLYQKRVVGNVTYSNGFVVSIQQLHLTDFSQTVWNVAVNGEQVPHATVRSRLNMMDTRVGFDVTVNLENPQPPFSAQEKYTGHFTHTLLQLQLDVTINLLTNEITSSPRWTNVAAGSGIRMIYMPATNLTEVLSRRVFSLFHVFGYVNSEALHLTNSTVDDVGAVKWNQTEEGFLLCLISNSTAITNPPAKRIGNRSGVEKREFCHNQQIMTKLPLVWKYQPSLNADSVGNWGSEVFGPKLVEIATHRIPFPELCFLNCPS